METQLALEIRKKAAIFDDAARDFENNPYIAEQLRLAANLATTLAHLIGGNGFRASFGPPGEWGYSTPIGKAVRNVYDGLDAPGIIAQELHAKRYTWLQNKSLDTISDGGVFAGMTPDNVVLNEEDLDDAIDKEIAAAALSARAKEA